MNRLRDMSGQRFGRLVVIERGLNAGRFTRWLCQCDCGKTKVISGNKYYAKGYQYER